MTCLHTCIIANENIYSDIVYRNNVLFQKLITVSMSHSQWIFSFVIDLSQIEAALRITNQNILTLKDCVTIHIVYRKSSYLSSSQQNTTLQAQY